MAVAQKTFLALRTLANRHRATLHCVAVSHASSAATAKWVDLLGGAWNIEVVVDEDRAAYAAWGLGLGSVWYVFNPTSQAQAWREKGWLGSAVATGLQRRDNIQRSATAPDVSRQAAAAAAGEKGPRQGTGEEEEDVAAGPGNVLGNKWQQAGAWAVNGSGLVVWGGKALRADDAMDLDAGMLALGLA